LNLLKHSVVLMNKANSSQYLWKSDSKVSGSESLDLWRGMSLIKFMFQQFCGLVDVNIE